MLSDTHPGGQPKRAFDDFQTQLAANRSEFFRSLALGRFYGFNRHGVHSSQSTGGAKAHYDGIVAFSQTDFTGHQRRRARA